jgi:hypothetical protein
VATTSNTIERAAAACAVAFIAVLAISAYWDPSIRVLHVFEALPYALAGVLCLRHHTFGYALGVAGGTFWLWMAGFLTTFVRNGFERVGMLVRTGTVDRLDLLIAAPAAIAAGGLVLFSVLGYVRRPRKSWRDLRLLLAATVLVPAFFLAIFTAFAPRYLAIFQRVFTM